MQVPYRTLHRFAVEECAFGRRQPTSRVADAQPGADRQVDYGRLGLLEDPASGWRLALQSLIPTGVLSRHMFVHLSFGQALAM